MKLKLKIKINKIKERKKKERTKKPTRNLREMFRAQSIDDKNTHFKSHKQFKSFILLYFKIFI